MVEPRLEFEQLLLHSTKRTIIDLFLEDLILDRDDSSQENIVQRLGLNPNIELLHAKGQATHHFFHGADDHV